MEDARRFIRRGCPVEYDSDLMSEDAISLLRSIIDADVSERLGCGRGGIAEIKSHPFFKDVEWDRLVAKEADDISLDVRKKTPCTLLFDVF